jgi:hypothetical protein
VGKQGLPESAMVIVVFEDVVFDGHYFTVPRFPYLGKKNVSDANIYVDTANI